MVTLDRWPTDAFAALLDQPPPSGDRLPPLWQWLYFLEHPRSDELGPDGHLASGHFLPPIPRRLRMFAGGRVEFRAPLRLGTEVHRDCRITDIVPKTGRSGEMLFVTERREYSDSDGLAVVEEQDVVYRQAPATDEGRNTASSSGSQHAPPAIERATLPDDRIGLLPDSRMLFRYSALTYNAHRIHHDEPYARDVEGYPGLVVHGPLLALLLLEPARRAGLSPDLATFTFRLRRPTFAGTPVVVAENGDDLSAGPPDGEPAVTGSVTWR
ncbi:FAS1-like dehydratase domain-containing protein [Actinomycetospora endophytica]|uniref:FAS1-like dehydratase domain-containing protein n=1 Tax=Actinomycetospora endophytica TaxID=2291215 RepID=UPI001E3C6A47|nr:MaoC family dehydratase N-terminal domain-containing protein [Actinomycetospora endophytica]